MKPKPFLGLAIADQLTAEYGIPTFNPSTGLFERASVSTLQAAPFRQLSASITGSLDDWNPTGLASADEIFISPSTYGFRISGIAAQPTGKRLVLHNVSQNDPVHLSCADSASAAANRFAFGPMNIHHILGPGDAVEIVYDGVSSRWKLRFTRKSPGPTFELSLDANDARLQTAISGTAAAATGRGDGSTLRIMDLATGTTTTGRSGVGTKDLGLFQFTGGWVRYGQLVRFPVLTPSALSDGTNSYTMRFGWLDSLSGEPTNGAYFRYIHSENSGKFVAVTRDNSAELTADSGITVAAGTYYMVTIAMRHTSADFYIGTPWGTLARVATLSGLPSASGRSFGVGASIIKSAGTTSRTFNVYPMLVDGVFH